VQQLKLLGRRATVIILMPVKLPFGLLRLLTRPNATGSPALTKEQWTSLFQSKTRMSAVDCGDYRYLPTYQIGCQRQ